MTKDDLKRLSNDIFFDNEHGEILPEAHRNFNNTLIDQVVMKESVLTHGDGNRFLSDDGSYKAFTDISNDLLPLENATYTLGNSECNWKSIFVQNLLTGKEEEGIRLQSSLLPVSNESINLGKETASFENLYIHKINGAGFSNTIWTKCRIMNEELPSSLYWAVSGNSLILSGEYVCTTERTNCVIVENIPEAYLKRVLIKNCCLDVKDNRNEIRRIPVNITVVADKIVFTSLQDGCFFDSSSQLLFSSFIIPLFEVIGMNKGAEYGEWDYSDILQTNSRTRTVKPWTQSIYADETVGDVIQENSYIETDMAINIGPDFIFEQVDAENFLYDKVNVTQFTFANGDTYDHPLGDEKERGQFDFVIPFNRYLRLDVTNNYIEAKGGNTSIQASDRTELYWFPYRGTEHHWENIPVRWDVYDFESNGFSVEDLNILVDGVQINIPSRGTKLGGEVRLAAKVKAYIPFKNITLITPELKSDEFYLQANMIFSVDPEVTQTITTNEYGFMTGEYGPHFKVVSAVYKYTSGDIETKVGTSRVSNISVSGTTSWLSASAKSTSGNQGNITLKFTENATGAVRSTNLTIRYTLENSISTSFSGKVSQRSR